MSEVCTCRFTDRPHHHGFGGTYPCTGEHCIPCQPVDTRERAVVIEPRQERR